MVTDKELTTSQNLPSLNQLFSNSWQLFKQKFLSLLILNLIGMGTGAAILLVLLLLGLVLGAGTALSQSGFSPSLFTGPLVILAVIAIVVMIILGAAIQVATVLILNKTYSDKSSTFQTLKNSKSLIWPLIIVSLLIAFFALGGTFLLIIPGIIISFLLYFSTYELILNNHKGLNALRRSFLVISSNFWGFLGRMILIWLLSIIISMALSMLSSDDSAAGGLASLVSFIFSIILSWFTSCYYFILYKEASKKVTGEGRKLMPIVITSILGWVLGILFLLTAGRAIGELMKNPEFQKGIQDGFEQGMEKEDDPSTIIQEYMNEEDLQEMQQMMQDHQVPQ